MSGLRLVDDTAYDATTWNGVVGLAPSKNAVRDAIEARAGLITVASEAADTTCFPLFATSATGTLIGVKSSTGLTFNSSTGLLGASAFSGMSLTSADELNLTTASNRNILLNVSGGGSVSVLGGDFVAGTTASTTFWLKYGNSIRLTGTATGTDFYGSAPIRMVNGENSVSFNHALTSAARTLTIPDASGTIALTSDKLSAFAATTSAELAGVISDETGTGALVFANTPTLVTPLLGTPTSGVLTNCTGTASGLTAGNVTTNANLTGPITSVGNATSIASQTGTGTKFVVDTSPTLVTPTLGVASATSLACATFTSAAEMTFTPTSASDIDATVAGGASFDIRGTYTLSGGFITAPVLKVWSTTTAAIDKGGAISFGGKTGNTVADYAFGFIRGGKGSVEANVYTGYLAFHTMSGGENGETNSGDYERMRLTGNGIGIGTTSPSALIHGIKTTEQLRLGYNTTEYLSVTQGATGTCTYDITTTGTALHSFSDNVSFSGSALSTSATAGVGYATGAGGTVTQATSRTTGVTLNKICGAITLVSAAGSASWQSFTVTNSAVAATDVVQVSQKSGTDLYMTHVTAVAAGSFQITFATTGGTTTEQPVFNFAVIKAVAA